MKLFHPICSMCPILFFGFANSKNQSMHLNFDEFVEGILDIRKFYAAATVIFAHPGEYGAYGDLQIIHLVHTCSKLLHKHHIMTLNMHFKKMRRSLKYHNQIVQPIVVAIIPTFESFLEFKEATKIYPMSFPVWFVLFLFTPGNDTHDHCHYPIDNPFNLRFDTQMLVSCYNANILQEWYSINGKTTKIFDIAKWENDRFIPLTTLSLYDRRNDLDGIVLRTVTVKEMPMSRKHAGKAENFIAKLFEQVVKELTQSLNFTLDIVSDMEENGIWNDENKTWSGVMGEIVSGRADIALAVMSMTSLRVRDVDFTFPLIISKVSFFFKEPGCDVKWCSYFQTFHIYTWAAIITVIAITPILLYLMKSRCKSQNRFHLLSDNFLYIWGIFCQQGLIEFPKCLSMRIAYFTIFLTAVLIMAHYSAALVSFLTSCTPVLPFRSMDEFLTDGTYKLVVQRADYNIFVISNESFSKQIMKVMKKESDLPSSVIDGFMQICTEKVAYLVLNALKESVEIKIPCKLSSVSTETTDNLGMVLSKDNQYTGVINYHLQKFLDNGIMMRLKDLRFFMQTNENKTYEPVHVINVIPILAILCGGIILGVVILLIEVIYYLLIHGK